MKNQEEKSRHSLKKGETLGLIGNRAGSNAAKSLSLVGYKPGDGHKLSTGKANVILKMKNQENYLIKDRISELYYHGGFNPGPFEYGKERAKKFSKKEAEAMIKNHSSIDLEIVKAES